MDEAFAEGWYVDQHGQVMYRAEDGAWFYVDTRHKQILELPGGDKSMLEWSDKNPNERVYRLLPAGEVFAARSGSSEPGAGQ